MPVQIEKKETIIVKDDAGREISKGDPLVIRVQKQDIACRFAGITTTTRNACKRSIKMEVVLWKNEKTF